MSSPALAQVVLIQPLPVEVFVDPYQLGDAFRLDGALTTVRQQGSSACLSKRRKGWVGTLLFVPGFVPGEIALSARLCQV